MKFGMARDLITPDFKTHMAGYAAFTDKFFETIHDDLFVKALWLDDGRSRIVLISLDLLFHDYELTRKVKAYLQDKYTIEPDRVLLAYTHTHLGPAARGYDSSQASEAYETFLESRIKSCLDRAFANSFEGHLSLTTIEGNWGVNRRKSINGRFEMLPNYEAAKDEELNVLKICDRDNRVRTLLLTYGSHPVILRATPALSAEYPGRLCQQLENAFYGSTSMFFQGAAGDSIPRLTAFGDDFKICTFDEVNDLATVMAGRILEAIHADRFEPVPLDLAARQFTIPLAISPVPKSTFEKIANSTDSSELAAFFRKCAREILNGYDRTPDIIQLPAGIFRLSDRVYVPFMSGEICYPVKQIVARAFAPRRIVFIGYGDATGYITGDEILRQGGYEAESYLEFCLKGPFTPTMDECIFTAFRENLEAICV